MDVVVSTVDAENTVPVPAASTATTRFRLLRAAGVLTVLTVLTAVLAFTVADTGQRTADGVRDDTVPALIEVAAARGALIKADGAATQSFETDAVQLSGPGDDYREQLAIANQNLTQAAVHDLGDDTSKRTLGLVNSLLTRYASAIERAAADYQQAKDEPLWASDLRDASGQLHASDGVLVLLDALRSDQLRKLDDQLADGTNPVLDTVGWMASALLVALLLCTQVWLARRFRRVLNWWLVTGTVAAIAMGVLSLLTLRTGDGLRDTGVVAHSQETGWRQRISVLDPANQRMVATVLVGQCGRTTGGCGVTVQRTVAGLTATPLVDVSGVDLTDSAAQIQSSANRAAEHGAIRFFIPVAAVLTVVLTWFGFYRRYLEYWFRRR